MDKVIEKVVPVAIAVVLYSIIAFILFSLISPPKDLKRKEVKDFMGQHLSIVHAYITIIGSLSVYIYEGGVDYNAPTNQRHTIVLAVRLTQNSLGYFLFDSVYGECHGVHDNAFRFHHVFAVSGILAMYLSTIGGSASVGKT
jgi:hypothetical protein